MRDTWSFRLFRSKVPCSRLTREPRPLARKRHFRPEVLLLEDRIVPSTLSGQVFNDSNGNGGKDGGEGGLSGWTVFLDSNHNGMPDGGEPSTVSATNGNYSFPNLGPGTYRVREVTQTGWTQTTSNPADV